MVFLVHSGMQGQPVTLLEPNLQCPVNWPCDGEKQHAGPLSPGLPGHVWL